MVVYSLHMLTVFYFLNLRTFITIYEGKGYTAIYLHEINSDSTTRIIDMEVVPNAAYETR